MKLATYLRESCIILRMQATDKWGAIDELLDRLVQEGAVQDPDRAREDVVAREKQMGTGMEEGVAIPHAKTKGVDDLVVVLGRAPDGIEFESLDGQRATLLFLVLSRADASGPHVECIAEIARVCSGPAVREAVLSAGSAKEIVEALRG